MLAKYGQLLRAIVGGPDPARVSGPTEVIAVTEVDNTAIDLLWPRGAKSWCGYSTDAAAAGSRSHVILENPAGSGVLCIVKSINAKFSNDAILIHRAGIIAGTSATGPVYGPRDFRDYGRIPTCRMLTFTGGGQGSALMRVWPDSQDIGVAGYYYFHPKREFVITPGRSLCVLGTSDNTLIWASFDWIERVYDQEEMRDAVV